MTKETAHFYQNTPMVSRILQIWQPITLSKGGPKWASIVELRGIKNRLFSSSIFGFDKLAQRYPVHLDRNAFLVFDL